MVGITGKPHPVVERFPFSRTELDEFISRVEAKGGEDEILLLKYPTVYVVYRKTGENYSVYVGETNSIVQRTETHLTEGKTRPAAARVVEGEEPGELDDVEEKSKAARSYWADFREEGSEIFVIGHSLFNKSMTLDVEDKLMLFLSSSEGVSRANKGAHKGGVDLLNARGNTQGRYFTEKYVDEAFSAIWRKLRRHDKKLFPLESLIRQSALFKASPFHKLNEEQLTAKVEILKAIDAASRETDRQPSTQSGKLVLVKGAAGTGKTVLLSSVFFELFQDEPGAEESVFDFQSFDAYLLVNHDEMCTVYTQIAETLGISDGKNLRVMKPTKFINEHDPAKPVDVVLVDEAHLLWTQGKQSYRGKNMLKDLLDRARVVIPVFDESQIMAGNQYWTPEELDALYERADHTVLLKEQMRIDSAGPAEGWIRSIIDDGVIHPVPKDSRYEIRVFESPQALHEAVKQRAQKDEESDFKNGISRLIATYDWDFKRSEREDGQTWDVVIGGWRLPWNNQISKKATKRGEKKRSWAEKGYTLDEVGSTFTVQGFDLNYAGVIIGPSVKYREGRIVFDGEESKNKGFTDRRTIVKDGKKVKVSLVEELLRNQLNVLLTRGVHGLYLFAVDEELQQALLAASR